MNKPIANLGRSIRIPVLPVLLVLNIAILTGCQRTPLHSDDIQSNSGQFTLAVISDTQNMIDYTHQTNEGFPIDGAELYIEHMQYLADNAASNGGDIVFATSVGDVWQHQGGEVDPEHYRRGLRALDRESAAAMAHKLERVEHFEIPLAKRGYDILAGTGLPFSVAPGNHDYDAAWLDSNFPPDFSRVDELRNDKGFIIRLDPAIVGMSHMGGYRHFNGVFGPDSPYFSGKDWYVGSFNGGVNSAQRFSAGGYTFLHIAFEMQPGDEVLSWARDVIRSNPGLPTIITTHDFLNARGVRVPYEVFDLTRVDPTGHNSAEDVWREFISVYDQIFLVLSGHQPGQSFRADQNQSGHAVYQVLCDFQSRGRAGLLNQDGSAVRQPPVGPVAGIGDGWIRLMRFDTIPDIPTIQVRTYSTYYKVFSVEQADYAAWYREQEQAELSDSEFMKADHFTIELKDFKQRFGAN